MIPMLESCEIDFFEMPSDTLGAVGAIEKATALARQKKQPVAVLARHGIFTSAKGVPPPELEVNQSSPVTRRAALEAILDLVGDSDFVVSTTGFTSRELYAIQQEARTGFWTSDRGELAWLKQGQRCRLLRRALGERKACLVHRRRCPPHMGSLASLLDLESGTSSTFC